MQQHVLLSRFLAPCDSRKHIGHARQAVCLKHWTVAIPWHTTLAFAVQLQCIGVNFLPNVVGSKATPLLPSPLFPFPPLPSLTPIPIPFQRGSGGINPGEFFDFTDARRWVLVHFGYKKVNNVQGESTVRPGKQVWLTFNGLKWNAMTRMSGDMAGASVTDFFILVGWAGPPMFGPDHASKVVGSWPMDRLEINAHATASCCFSHFVFHSGCKPLL